MKPLAIDLCCGLGGWTAGLLSEGWDVIGFDIERHEYGEKRYPADLILKSILDLNGYDLRAVSPALVVASPPCQEYSYMAMPWSRAKQIAGAFRAEVPFPDGYAGSQTVEELTALFDACFRIAREIGCPIVLENVKGAQPWVGRANAHYGSYYLWGDVGNVGGRVVKADRSPRFGEYVGTTARCMKGRSNFHFFEQTGLPSPSFHGAEHEASVQRAESIKNDGGSWFNVAHNTESGTGQNPVNGVKRPGMNWSDRSNPDRMFNDARAVNGALKTVGHVNKRDGFDHTRHLTKAGHSGRAWFADPDVAAHFSSKSDSRKAASAMIAEIPFPLAQHIARVFKPTHS